MLIVFCFWPGSIFGGPHVHQLRPDCGEIYDCNEIAFIVCVGVGDVTNLACGCSSWLNRVVYYPWVAWLFQYLAAGFSKTRDFITKLSGTADYYYLRAPPLCSVPGGWRRRKRLEWRNAIALVMMAYLLHGTSSYCVNYALLLLHGTLRDCPAMEKAFFSASGLIRQE